MVASVPKLRLARQGAITTILVLVAAAPAFAAGSYGYGGAGAATPGVGPVDQDRHRGLSAE
jgi:hypothetical protein